MKEQPLGYAIGGLIVGFAFLLYTLIFIAVFWTDIPIPLFFIAMFLPSFFLCLGIITIRETRRMGWSGKK